MKRNVEQTTIRRSILLFEPNRHIRSMHTIMLHTHGYKVESTGNEAEAHAICESMRPDLVLVGISEPLEHTFKAFERFQRRHPKQKITLSPGEGLTLAPLSYNGVVVLEAEASDDLLEHVRTLLKAA
jgi:DNA-binding NtrC family response regulator